MREKLTQWLIFLLLCEGVLFLTLLIILTLVRMLLGER